MIRKVASYSFTDIKALDDEGLVKFASSGNNGVGVDGEGDVNKVVRAEMEKRPNALFFRAKAIEADIPNNNGDAFSKDELKKAYQTFVNCPFFTNHQNQDVEKAKGKVVWAEWDDDDNAIYIVAFIDRDAYPHLCRGIEQEYMSGVSMGCSVEYSECSLCRNRASTIDEYCTHIRNMKGRSFTGTVKDAQTGETLQIKNKPVYENNFGIRFIELSGVADPACPSCRIDQIYRNDDFLDKAAATAVGCFNSVALFKAAMLEKDASQQDIEQLNQCLQTIEQVSVKLIQNRQNVEMDFASDLVEILANLQGFVEELVQAGYGQLPDAGVPGVAEEQAAVPGAEEPMPAQPVAAEEELGGEVTGSPEEPLVEAPAAPSPLEGLNQATRPSPSTTTRGLARPTRPERTTNSEEEGMLPRKHAKDRERTKAVLSDAWQEKIENLSSTLKESVQKDPATSGEKTGGQNMAVDGIRTEAKSANADQHVITEKQLENGTGLDYHPREDQPRETITQDQLEPEREGDRDVITEAQLDDWNAREDAERETITEDQLDAVRTDVEKETITQDQLGSEGYRTDEERETITEDQLSDPKWETPWSRAAADVSTHVKYAVASLAKAAVASGATPEEIVRAAASLASGTASAQLRTAAEIYQHEGGTEAVSNIASRASYWREKGVKVASEGTSVREAIIAYAAEAMREADLNPETLIETYERIAKNKSIARIEAAVDELLSSENPEEVDLVSEIDKELAAEAEAEEEAVEGEGEEEIVAEAESEAETEEETVEASTEEEAIEAETEALEGAVAAEAKADLGIEATVSELGVDPDSDEFREAAEQFARGACAARNIKVASIVNVTVSDDTVTIAVETDGESVEIPLGGEEEEVVEEAPVEEPLPEEGAMQEEAVGTEQPAGEDNILSLTSSKPKIKRKAQFGGGAPEVPGAGAGVAPPEDVATAPATGAELPEEGGVQTFTEEEEVEEELPGEEQQPAGSICPFCGSDDTETGKKDQQPGQFDCNNCGAKYMLHVNVEVLNPEELVSENLDEDLEEPEEPVLPVAACIDINRDVMRKLAENEKQYGISCPGCGSAEVEITEDEGLSKTVECKKCATVSHRDFLINADNVEEGKLMVRWDIDPAKTCHTCAETRKAFASERVFNKMMKRAGTVEFPAERAKSWIEQRYGKNTLVSNGPHKGEVLADTVVGQLQRFGLTKVKYMESLASAQSAEDPMDTCIKDHRLKGHKPIEARRICNCMKEEFASEYDDNIFIQAFDGMINRGVLRKMAGAEQVEVPADDEQIDEGEMDIADIEVTASEEGQEIEDEASAKLELFTEEEKDEMVEDKEAAAEGEAKTAAAKQDGEVKREYESFGSEKGLPRTTLEEDKDVFSGDAKMGHEDPPPDKGPDVPKAPNSGYLGHEQDAIAKGEEAKVPVDSEYMGHEEKLGDEDINTKTLGLAASEDEVKTASSDEEARKKEHMSTDGPGQEGTEYGQVESIEGADDVPRSDAKMGHENETIPEAGKPQVPRSDAKMGHENETVPEAAKPTVPRTDESEHVETLGRVAEVENEQRAKLAEAKRQKAIKLAARLVAANAIKDDEFDEMVEELASFSLERMETFAKRLMKAQVKTASTLPTGVVIEARNTETEEEPSLQEQLQNAFTFGSQQSDKLIKSDIAEDE